MGPGLEPIGLEPLVPCAFGPKGPWAQRMGSGALVPWLLLLLQAVLHEEQHVGTNVFDNLSNLAAC